jgi:hypothetical protein
MEFVEARNLMSGTYRYEHSSKNGVKTVYWHRGTGTKYEALIARGEFWNKEKHFEVELPGFENATFYGDEAKALLKCGVLIIDTSKEK